jgi:hypothetical protein
MTAALAGALLLGALLTGCGGGGAATVPGAGAGETITLRANDFSSGADAFACSVAGRREAGMTGTRVVG